MAQFPLVDLTVDKVMPPPEVCPDPAPHAPHDIPTPVNTVFHCKGRAEPMVVASERSALLRKASDDHDLMQSRIDNQKAIIDRLQARLDAALKLSEGCTCADR